MNDRFARIVFLFVICIVAYAPCAAYTVSGTLKNLTCFYPKVYLALIPNIDGFYRASYKDGISSADVDSVGNFTITGNDLPDEPGFYRLFVTTEKESISVHAGSIRNYIFLALTNKTNVTINCDNFCKPYFTYSIRNSPENEAVLSVQNILLEYNSLKWDSLGESKTEFLMNKRYADLKQFADTSRSLLAGLWAVTEMHIDSNYYSDASFFNSFANRFRAGANAPTYARQLDDKLQLLQYKKEVKYYHPSVFAFLVVCVLLGCSVILNIYLSLKKRPLPVIETIISMNELPPAERNLDEIVKGLIEKLTIKEREILKMVNEGLSNKEIADRLNVEVSTIKTHISNIYQKTDIKNRKEVAGIARFL